MCEFQHLAHLLIKTVRRITGLLWSKPNDAQPSNLLSGNSHTERKVDSARGGLAYHHAPAAELDLVERESCGRLGALVDRQLKPRTHLLGYRISSTPSLARNTVELHLRVPHGVTVSCKRYTMEFPLCYGSPSDIFAASSMFQHLYTLRLKEYKKKKQRRWWQKQLYAGREVYSGSSLLAGLHFQLVTGL